MMKIQSSAAVPPLRTIAMILAQGVIRLHQRQKALDNFTEQSVHSDSCPQREPQDV
jgi:hypothetical protein